MRFFFIRHGQSTNNALWEANGYEKGRCEDPELTDIGRRQAHNLGEFIRLKDEESLSSGNPVAIKRDYFGFTHIYTSLMVRSVATGSYIAQAVGIPLTAWPEIHETGGIFLEDEVTGEFRGLPGKNRSYFVEKYPGLVLPEALTDEGWWNRAFEADEERQVRAQLVLKTLFQRHGNTDDRVAIVSHGGFYMHFMREVFGLQSERIWFHMNNTGVSRIDFHPNGEAVLIFHNRTDHLPDNLLT